MLRTEIQSYVNNFRRRLGALLRPGIGVACNIFPSVDGGGVLEFKLGPGLKNEDIYKGTYNTIGDAVIATGQKALSGELHNVKFKGTNIILEPGRIILIKDKNKKQWKDSAAQIDVTKVTHPVGIAR